jgi:hypothetical protein
LIKPHYSTQINIQEEEKKTLKIQKGIHPSPLKPLLLLHGLRSTQTKKRDGKKWWVCACLELKKAPQK